MGNVVVNSTPLIVLGNIGQLQLLRKLFDSILVPEAVLREVTSKDDRASRYLLGKPNWIDVRKAPPTTETSLLPAKLHAGEIEVILLAKQVEADAVVLDDNAARRTAAFLGLNVTGTLGILLLAKQRGLIDSVGPVVQSLQAGGFRISDSVVIDILRLAHEL